MRDWFIGFNGRHPLFVAALVTVTCVGASSLSLGWALALGILWAICGWFAVGWKQGLAWLACGWIALAGFTWREASRLALEKEILVTPGGMMRARILEDGRGSERFWVAPARLLEGEHRGVKVWWEGSGEVPVAGAVVSSRGGFATLPEPRNRGEFDRATWLRRQGVAAVYDTGRLVCHIETGRLARLGASIRHGFRARVTAGFDESSLQARIIRAVVIGERPADSEDLIAAFRNSGTLHVFSVSGLHVAMVGSMGWLILSWAGVPRRWAVPLLLPMIFGYAWLTGHSPPAVRAAWMAAVFLGAFVFRRKPDLLNALGAVLLVAMLWDGRMLFQPGVQLSYGVVAAIAIGVGWASRVFHCLSMPELYLPVQQMSRWQRAWLGLRRKTAQSLSVSLAAGVGSAPLTAVHFGLITPISVLASLVLVPVVFLLLATALFSAALFSVSPPVSRALNHLNGYVAVCCAWTAEGFSEVPGGHFLVRTETRPMLLVYDLEYGAGAACFSDGAGNAVLLDCGDRQGFEQIVLPSLRQLGIAPDSVVLSHPDGGHIGGGAAVWDAFPIRQALMPVKLSRSPAYRSWMENGPRAGIRMNQALGGRSLPFPDAASLEILHTPDSDAVNSVADGRVMISRLHWRGWKFLLTSDAGMGSELELLDTGRDLSADVIIAGLHTNDLTLCDRFLDAVQPRAIIASNSRFPLEERRNPKSIAYWKSRGIHVIDQEESGGVSIFVDDKGNLRLEGFLSAAPLVLSPR